MRGGFVFGIALASAALTISAQAENAVLQGYVSNVDADGYVNLLGGGTDCSRLNEVYQSISARTDLSAKEKTDYMKAVGDKFAKNVDKEFAVEKTKIWAGGIAGILVQTGSAYIPNSWLSGAVDGLGESLANGELLSGDFRKVGERMAAGAAMGGAQANFAKKIGKLGEKIAQNEAFKNSVGKLQKKLSKGVVDYCNKKSAELSEQWLKLNGDLKPMYQTVMNDLTELSRKLGLNKKDIDIFHPTVDQMAEIERLSPGATAMVNQMRALSSDIANVEKQINRLQGSFDEIETFKKAVKKAVDYVANKIATSMSVSTQNGEIVFSIGAIDVEEIKSRLKIELPSIGEFVFDCVDELVELGLFMIDNVANDLVSTEKEDEDTGTSEPNSIDDGVTNSQVNSQQTSGGNDKMPANGNGETHESPSVSADDNSQTKADNKGDIKGGHEQSHTTTPDVGKTTTADGSSPTQKTPVLTTTTTTSDGNNPSTDQSGIAEWRKIAYEVLTGKKFPDGDNTGPTTADGQNTGNSSDNGNSGNNKGQNSPNGGNEQNTSNSDSNGSGSDGQNNNAENRNGQDANGQNNGSNVDGKNGKTANNGTDDTGTATENERTGENGKTVDRDVPKNPVVATTQDDFVNMGMSNGGNDGNSGLDALAQQMLKEYLTGEAQVLSPDFIPGAFGSLSSDPQKAETIANEAFGHAVDSAVSDGAVSQAIKDFMSQGGDVQQTLSSFLDGKVTEDQKSQILTLSDALGKVGEDGGKSLINALGDQGAQLADSLVINEIKNQLLSSLPKDQAEQLNAIIGTLDAKGLSAETKQKIAGVIQDSVSKTLPNYSAETINGLIQDVVDGNSIDKLDTVKDLGKSITADALKAVLKNNLDPKLAGEINSLIDGYMKNGTQGLSEAALKELNALIDQYAPGANTAKLLKDTVNGIVSGTANPADWKDVATSVVSDAANKLIDESNLPQDVKDAAKAAVNGLAQNGLTGLTTNMRDFISDYVSDKLGSDEAGEAVGKIFDAVVTPGIDPWQEIVKQAPVVGMALAEKCLAEAEKLAAQQIDKLIAKYPNVKKVLDKLCINGAGIVQGVVNVLGVLLAAPNLSTAITQLSAMAVNFLKNIAVKLIDWALEWAVSWLNNTLMPKVLTWASNTLEKWADSVDNDLIKKGLEYLKQQCENCKKQGGIKIKTAGTGKKVVDYVDDLIKKRKKSQSGTTVLKSK